MSANEVARHRGDAMMFTELGDEESAKLCNAYADLVEAYEAARTGRDMAKVHELGEQLATMRRWLRSERGTAPGAVNPQPVKATAGVKKPGG